MIFSCSRNEDKMDSIFGNEDKPQEYATDIMMIYRDSMEKKVELRAPVLRRIVEGGKKKSLFDDGVHVTFFNKAGRKQSYLTAGWALKEDKNGKVTCRDEVVLINIAGDTIVTSELIWDEKQEIIYTRKFVKIKRPHDQVMTGYGFNADQEFTKYEMNALEGDYQVEDSPTEKPE